VASPNVDFGGTGLIVLDDGGRLVVEGSVGADQAVLFADGKASLVIDDASSFQAEIGLTQYGGDQMDITDARAGSDSF
jgi:hypothetical protein